MTQKGFFPIVIIIFVLSCLSLAGPAESGDDVRSTPPVTLGLERQTGLSLTVYSSGLGLVKDRREFKAGKGKVEVRFTSVPSRIIPSSVTVRAASATREFRVLEQDYEYDLLSPQKLLDKYVGKEVKLYSKNPYSEREQVVTATLLSNNGGPVFMIGGEITFGHPGRIIFPGLPENLFSSPTLVWTVDNGAEVAQAMEASYLTDGLSWHADYLLTLDEGDDFSDLSSWVTIENKSGATYRNASLALVAGEVARAGTARADSGMVLKATAEAAPAPFGEEAFFEYHLYTLKRTATIRDNQTKQIGFISSEHIRVRKELVLEGRGDYYFSRLRQATVNRPVSVMLTLENSKEYNLGAPLPAGTVRVYKRDRGGNLRFAGEDSIKHTPEGEKIVIKAGDAFDIAASRTQMDWKKVASDTFEESFAIKLRNHSPADVTVRVVEPIPGDWTILNSSSTYRKTSSSTAEFSLPVSAGKEAGLTYTVRIRM